MKRPKTTNLIWKTDIFANLYKTFHLARNSTHGDHAPTIVKRMVVSGTKKLDCQNALITLNCFGVSQKSHQSSLSSLEFSDLI